MTTAQIELPPKMIANFSRPAKHRVFPGGRGSGKTKGLAKMSAIYGYKFAEAGRVGLILSSREHLNSLDESSMEEIKAAIRSEPWLPRPGVSGVSRQTGRQLIFTGICQCHGLL